MSGSHDVTITCRFLTVSKISDKLSRVRPCSSSMSASSSACSSSSLSDFISSARSASVRGSEWASMRDLNICSHVFLREGVTHDALQPPYSGPHLVVGMDDKTYTVRIRGKDTRVSIDRIKPAYVLAEDIPPTTGTPVVNYRDSRNHHSQRRTTTDATSS
ncbi:hypothetical protein M513_00870 [Trichuris suis]|uniref:Uncharacterized protein n=1 Tax=Trichuris suis TaxID=68888 RepID=A0A085MLL1_9BILA|nr:hypothetical protein M513_00870 [Trichuris suis]